MKYEEIEGDLVSLAKKGKFDIVAQGNNCHIVQGAGLAPQFVKAFGSDKFPMEDPDYKGRINKLGTIDYQTGAVFDGKFEWTKDNNQFEGSLTVINCYTQFMYGTNHTDGVSKPLDYEALTLCLRKINHIFKGKHIGLPYVIGCGLAGGDINTVIELIKKELCEMQVTMVKYNK